MKYYILSVESFVDTFSIVDAMSVLKVSIKVQNQNKILSALKYGDELLIYRKKPIGKINILFVVNEATDTHCILLKKLEVAEGVSVEQTGVMQDLEAEDLVQISDTEFQNIYQMMVSGLMPESQESRNINANRLTNASNVLLYGVPGVGKSYEIQQRYCDDPKRIERVVFHPDYSCSDFVGQILPRLDGEKLMYVFTPGPFTRVLKKAWNNPEKEYYLVIEEINRGNAPAIFGEIFQLLDRKTKDNPKYLSSEYGESEYAISNYDIALYTYDDASHEVRIPSNMWILATMNTSDQNVFTLDTAFQRRWDMLHVKNNVYAAEHAHEKIQGTMIDWGAFTTVINDMVININLDMASSEDKRLGAYFAKCNELTDDKFPHKVLKYLWDDAFKMDRDSLFNEQCRSLERVIEIYETEQTDKLKAVLKAEVYEKMLSVVTNEEF